MLLALVGAVAGIDWPAGLVHRGGAGSLGRILSSFLQPDLSLSYLATVGQATLVTVGYAVTGMSVAVAIGLPGAVLVSGALFDRPGPRRTVSLACRGLFGGLRAIHELVWALIFVTILGLTPLAGVLAIGLPYGATLARVLGEHLQDVRPEPVDRLRDAGASPLQTLFYARIPLAGADILAYLTYRFECAVRAAAVLSFIGLGGIGYRLTITLADQRFERVWPLLGSLVLLIALIDVMGGRLRNRVVL